MAATVNISAVGTSPAFSISAEEMKLNYFAWVTPVDIDGVNPPDLTQKTGFSVAMSLINWWFPWIDEKLVEPKYDGVCQYLGMPSNRPSYVKDYHTIALMRATDYLLQPRYVGLIRARVGSSSPNPPPGGP